MYKIMNNCHIFHYKLNTLLNNNFVEIGCNLVICSYPTEYNFLLYNSFLCNN